MIDVVFSEEAYSRTTRALLAAGAEACAIAQCRIVSTTAGFRLLPRDIVLAAVDDYAERSPVSAVLRPSFIAPIVARAAAHRETVAFIHTHPGGIRLPRFSSVDSLGETVLQGFLNYRLPRRPHVSIVMNEVGATARQIPNGESVRVITVGKRLRLVSEERHADELDRFDRQVRALGPAGHAALRSLRIGVVGLGGTGSVVAQHLAYLGIQTFILIDPDTIDRSSLNRVVGATEADIGVSKVGVAKRLIASVSPGARVDAIEGDVRYRDDALRLLDADIIFCCTDSHGSRAVLNQLAYQFMLPCIDMGVVIVAKAGRVDSAFGRVQLLAPGEPCLLCSGVLNSEEVRRDLMTDAERRSDPYIIGAAEPQPAVITLNSVVASLGTTMLVGVATEFPADARVQLFDALKGVVRRAAFASMPGCVVCSYGGATARGHEWSLPARVR